MDTSMLRTALTLFNEIYATSELPFSSSQKSHINAICNEAIDLASTGQYLALYARLDAIKVVRLRLRKEYIQRLNISGTLIPQSSDIETLILKMLIKALSELISNIEIKFIPSKEILVPNIGYVINNLENALC